MDAISTASFERERRGSWTSSSGSSHDSKQDITSPQIFVPSPVSSQYSYTTANYSPVTIDQSPVTVLHTYAVVDNSPTIMEQSASSDTAMIVHQDHNPEQSLVQRMKRNQSPVTDSADYQWDTIYYAPRIFDNDSQRAINFFNAKTVMEIGKESDFVCSELTPTLQVHSSPKAYGHKSQRLHIASPVSNIL